MQSPLWGLKDVATAVLPALLRELLEIGIDRRLLSVGDAGIRNSAASPTCSGCKPSGTCIALAQKVSQSGLVLVRRRALDGKARKSSVLARHQLRQRDREGG